LIMSHLINSIFHTLSVDAKGENFCFSPASYMEVMNALLSCLKGRNQQELLDAIGIKPDDIQQYVWDFTTRLGDLERYNALFYSDEYKSALNPKVLDFLWENCQSDLKSFSNLDFLVSEVNQIVRDKTHGKIDGILTREMINDLTKFVILNCLYFKREWAHEFSEHWKDQEFKGTNRSTQLRFLRLYESLRYYEDEYVDIVQLRYKQSEAFCYLFVLKKDGWLIGDNIDSYLDRAKQVNFHEDTCVELMVPPFKIESRFSLVQATKYAGVNSLFGFNQNWDLVDFSNLLPEASLAVSDIIQRTYFDFTKRGTEAAAATVGIAMMSGCAFNFHMPKIKTIHADRPFSFALVKDDIPLFIGNVNNI
jgi:serine protease inhibitor